MDFKETVMMYLGESTINEEILFEETLNSLQKKFNKFQTKLLYKIKNGDYSPDEAKRAKELIRDLDNSINEVEKLRDIEDKKERKEKAKEVKKEVNKKLKPYLKPSFLEVIKSMGLYLLFASIIGAFSFPILSALGMSAAAGIATGVGATTQGVTQAAAIGQVFGQTTAAALNVTGGIKATKEFNDKSRRKFIRDQKNKEIYISTREGDEYDL